MANLQQAPLLPLPRVRRTCRRHPSRSSRHHTVQRLRLGQQRARAPATPHRPVPPLVRCRRSPSPRWRRLDAPPCVRASHGRRHSGCRPRVLPLRPSGGAPVDASRTTTRGTSNPSKPVARLAGWATNCSSPRRRRPQPPLRRQHIIITNSSSTKAFPHMGHPPIAAADISLYPCRPLPLVAD